MFSACHVSQQGIRPIIREQLHCEPDDECGGLCFPKDLLLGQSGDVHLVEAGGEAGAVQFPLLAEHDGVAVGSVGDVHRHTSCVQVGGEGPVLEAAIGY